MAGSTEVAPPTHTQFIANGSVAVVGRVAQFRLKKTSLKVRIVSEAGNRLDSRLRVQKDRPRILRGMGGQNCAQMYGKRGWNWGGIEGILWFAAGPQVAKNTNILLSKDPVK